jgi:hypothetical protein
MDMTLAEHRLQVERCEKALEESAEKKALDEARAARNLALYRAFVDRGTEPLTSLCRSAGVSRSYGGRVVAAQGRPDHSRAARK